MNKYLLRGISILSGAGLAFSGLAPVNVYAASTQSSSLAYRTKVINLTGIYTGEASEETVTRGEFAKMTVLASSYKDTVTGANTVNVFSDVSKDHKNSEYIRVAARQGYMRSFLGGNFKPDEGVTLNDAAKAVLTLLGYTDEDFSGNVSSGRLERFKALELNKNMTKSAGTDVLNYEDCINIFYNLLRTEPKDSSAIYGSSVFDVSLASDGEINPDGLVDETMVGPVLVNSLDELQSIVPFDINEAQYYYNGDSSRQMAVRSALQSYGWIVVYYNENAHTIFAYGQNMPGGSDTRESTYYVTRGNVSQIYYSANDLITPTSITLDGGRDFALGTSEVQFMFSINGDIKVGDDVVVVCQESATGTDSDGDTTYTYQVIGVIKFESNPDGSTTGVIYAGNADSGVVVTDENGNRTTVTTSNNSSPVDPDLQSQTEQ